MKLRTITTTLVAACALAAQAQAQYVPVDFSSQIFNAMNIHSAYVLNKICSMRPTQPQRTAPPVNPPPLITKGSANAAHRLAAGFPAEHQAEAEKQMALLLTQFGQIESQIGLTHGDAGGALACLVIGSYEAYRDTTLDQALYPPVIRQMQTALRGSPKFTDGSEASRRSLYEETAILGMYVIATRLQLKTRRDPATAQRLREAAAN